MANDGVCVYEEYLYQFKPCIYCSLFKSNTFHWLSLFHDQITHNASNGITFDLKATTEKKIKIF